MSETHSGTAEPAPETELFVEFANTARLSSVDAPDPVHDLQVLSSWLQEHALVGAAPVASRLERALPAFRELRALIREVALRVDADRPPTRAQVGAINRILREGLHYHALRPAPDGSRFSMTPVGDDLQQARSAVAGSLAHYLAEHDPRRLRVCADDSCRWLFVDRSPAGRRRWCDMRSCGNRAKVARHRARRRAAIEPGPEATRAQ